MTKIDTNKIMTANTGRRDCDLHVQITKANKKFLKEESDKYGIVMGLYLDKLLTTIKNSNG